MKVRYEQPQTIVVRLHPDALMYGIINTSTGASANESDDTNLSGDGIGADESDAKRFGFQPIWDD